MLLAHVRRPSGCYRPTYRAFSFGLALNSAAAAAAARRPKSRVGNIIRDLHLFGINFEVKMNQLGTASSEKSDYEAQEAQFYNVVNKPRQEEIEFQAIQELYDAIFMLNICLTV
jgi:hypothetical protein